MTALARSATQERPLVGYTSTLSVHPGETLDVMVSSEVGSFRPELVRLIGGVHDAPNVAREQHVQGVTGGIWNASAQPTPVGSYVEVPLDASLDLDEWTFSVWLYPTRLPADASTGLMAALDASGAACAALILLPEGDVGLTRAGGSDVLIRTGQLLRSREWYWLAASFSRRRERAVLWQTPRSPWLADETRRVTARASAIGGPHAGTMLIGALGLSSSCGRRTRVVGTLNGKLATPSVWKIALGDEGLAMLDAGHAPLLVEPEQLVGSWDLGHAPSTAEAIDVGPLRRAGVVRGGPGRAATGPRWSGTTGDFRAASREYDAIHFHDDDLEDAGWDPTVELRVPRDLQSGVYAVRLGTDGFVDRVPFVVSPALGRPTARVAVLLPTLTYLAYANRRHGDEMLRAALAAAGRRAAGAGAEELDAGRPELGLSLYDAHSDGSQVSYASLLRPLVELRPDHVNGVLGVARHFSADLHLISWLSRRRGPVDVITDHDLDRHGYALLERYRVVLTGSHPEYCTGAMLDALGGYVHSGGRLMYLGGNGFYFVASTSARRPHLMEVRRTPESVRFGSIEAGEGHASLTGERGGIWQHRGRPPQQLTGVGATAWGLGPGAPYHRTAASFRPDLAWLFRGVPADGDRIGDGGPLGGAAADELDRADATLGTPPAARVVATSRGRHGAGYEVLPEDRPQSGASTDAALVRADLTLVDAPNGGRVFSVGSIGWVIALPDCADVSQLTENVLARFSARPDDIATRRSP